jgi:hypothetical protein
MVFFTAVFPTEKWQVVFLVSQPPLFMAKHHGIVQFFEAKKKDLVGLWPIFSNCFFVF